MAEIGLNGEQWTAEGARLLLEVDEGWMGYRNDSAWSWSDDSYVAYHAVCLERKWLSHSLASCAAMLRALRTGAISMTLSSDTRSADHSVQWSLLEMRELGAQMRRVVDGQYPKVRWATQFAAFVKAMKAKDHEYDIKDRTVEDFATRAAKYVPKRVLRLIDSIGVAKAKSRVAKGRGKSLVPRTTRSGRASERGRKRSIESDGDTSYHDPTSEDEDILWVDEESLPPTQELTSQGELLPVQAGVDERPALTMRNSERPSPPLEAVDQAQPSSATNEQQTSPRQQPLLREEPVSRQTSPRQEEPVQQQASLRVAPVQRRTPSCQNTANGRQSGGCPSLQPSRKYLRVQQASNKNRERASNKSASTMVRNLNPYDRPGKPWGEFVVEVLLAERTARNEDELDYVQFVRSLYEI